MTDRDIPQSRTNARQADHPVLPPEAIAYVDDIVTAHQAVGRDIAEMLFLNECGLPPDKPASVFEQMWSEAIEEITEGVHRSSRSHALNEPAMLDQLVSLTADAFYARFDELSNGVADIAGGRA